jgi:hypothetical protein
MKVLPLPTPTAGPAAATDTTLGDGASDAAAGFVAALAEALAAVPSEPPAEPAEELVAITDAPDATVAPDAAEDAPADPRSATAVAVLGVIAEWRAAGRTDKLGETVRAAVAEVAGRSAPAAPPAAVAAPAVPVAAEAVTGDAPPASHPDAPSPSAADDPVPAATPAAPIPDAGDAPATVRAAGGALAAGGVEAFPADATAPAPAEQLPERTIAPTVDASPVAADPAVTIGLPVSDAPRSERTTRPLPSAAAERVLRAIEVLQHAPPPRRLSFEIDGVRITVALQADGVAVDLRGPGGPVPATWRSDLGATLAAHGFDLASGSRDHDQPPPRPDAPPASAPTAPGPAATRSDHGLRL